ncbi:glycosyltransferase family 2 protein [Ruegeria sp. Alg231-54]|uniref:glycosyltransferase family 2 protein n=1 Tax=Ruegeria sp. Alg231-54 TaxID=1922221 RepID=UPI001901F096|nr:glycosyltransferase [Ruegeria sp. Alg231-54]
MLISVIIPHYNQPEHLRTCLDVLHRQKNHGSDVEILVVDNGSTQSPQDICSVYPEVRLLFQGILGPGPGRNLGAEQAHGDILAFIDADCHAHENWLFVIEAAFRNPDTQIIGGDVQVQYAIPGHPTFLEPYERIYGYRNRKYIAEGYSGTGNLAMRAEVFEKVGLFAGLEVAEDRDWGFRAKSLGYTTIYFGDMIVHHPAHKSFVELARKWDRHISHDYSDYYMKPFGRLRWLVRAIAVAGSPAGEIGTVLMSKRLRGTRERGLALVCLVRIRLYRARRMLQMAFTPRSMHAEGDWSR